MPDSIEMLQIKNDALEDEVMNLVDSIPIFDKEIKRELKKKIQMYSNIAYALGYEEGKEK